MATSNSYDWLITRADIIKSAYRKIGALGDFESPTTEQTNAAIIALQAMIKAWQADGMPVWAIGKHVIDLSALSTGAVNVGEGQAVNIPKPLKLLQAYTRRSDKDTPVQIYDRFSFANLVNISLTGVPYIVYYQPLNTYGVLSCYPKPDTEAQTNVDLVIHYQKMFEDMDSDSDNLGFPGEWTEAIIYGLAVRMAPEYGLSINERQQLKMEAKEIRDLALSFGTEEGSLFIQPA